MTRERSKLRWIGESIGEWLKDRKGQRGAWRNFSHGTKVKVPREVVIFWDGGIDTRMCLNESSIPYLLSRVLDLSLLNTSMDKECTKKEWTKWQEGKKKWMKREKMRLKELSLIQWIKKYFQRKEPFDPFTTRTLILPLTFYFLRFYSWDIGIESRYVSTLVEIVSMEVWKELDKLLMVIEGKMKVVINGSLTL